ncbi:hypothetical protein MMC18_007078 [Xylographa bjoerkii]|nr:hypothetical protein [Xylographa bjoerkii]
MAKLLSLARELRDYIYLAVLQAEVTPPSSAADCGLRYAGRQGFMHTREPVVVNSNGLLLVNHQVHDETKVMIRQLKKDGELRYKLDCMLVDEQQIYPTWLSIPAFSTRVSKVEVDFRSTGVSNYCESRWSPMWILDARDQSWIVYNMYHLLHKFLEKGPYFLAARGGEDMMRIDELIINVITPSPIPAEGFRSPDVSNPGEAFRLSLLHPEAGLEKMIDGTNFLLYRTDERPSWSVASYAVVVFERVRLIKILLDGNLRKVWNIREIDAQNPKSLRRHQSVACCDQ